MLRKTIFAFALFPAVCADFDLGFLRGQSEFHPLEQFSCTLSGGTDQDSCDATTSDDGSKCVWCSISSFGVCVSEDIAEKMKGSIPGLKCDDDSKTDDAVTTDDMAPATDDTTPNDDSTPDDYWNCLKKYADSTNCTKAGCAWCDTTGGFGICMDKDAASNASKSDWFDCKMPDLTSSVTDPYDPSCIAVTLQQDESICKATKDSDGNACEWCSFQSTQLCLNEDQAQIAEQIGGTCNDDDEDTLSDPYDPSCIAVTLQGDESTCKSTTDADGMTCEWCTVGTTHLCLNGDQAQIAEQIGGSCEEDQPDSLVSWFFRFQ